MEDENVIIVKKSESEKAYGVYGTSQAKIMNNPLGAIGGGVLAWYLTKKYTGIESKWAFAGIILVGAVAGAYTMSAYKRSRL